MADRIPMTIDGRNKLLEELSRLKSVDRHRIVREIEAARGLGDLAENAEYHAAKERQGQLEARIRFIEDQVARAEVVDTSRVDGSRVVFGVTVTVYDPSVDKEMTYKIVGEVESDIQKGLISVTSPIARALIGKEVGDEAVVSAPGGQRTLEIVGIALR